MSEPLVRLEQVTKQFGTAPPAVSELTTQIAAGALTALAGPDGAGKTTLLRLITGLLKADGGKISVCGLDPISQSRQLRKQIAYMPQRFGLYEDLTVLENLNLYADLRAVFGAERRAAQDKQLEFTGLGPFTKRLAGALSGGMKQKLGLACAMVGSPRLLLLDEPSVGVDPVSRRELWRMVEALITDDIGVVWSTAYLDEAERCQSAVLMNEGKLVFRGAPGDFTAPMSGRSFHIENTGTRRRAVATAAAKAPGVIDVVIQGAKIRIVTAKVAKPPDIGDLDKEAGSQIAPTPPRFEDAFVSLLGSSAAVSSLGAGATEKPRRTGPVIEAKDLTRKFGAFTAADRITFLIGRGEIFGLLGPNGAGKSTVFKMLCGLLKPTSGEARVAGLDLATATAEARNRLGYMAQQFSLYRDLSVSQNLNFFAGVYGLSGQAKRAAMNRVTDAFGLKRYLDMNAGLLPAGYKQRLALSCAIMHDPPVLFLDEPTSGVDPLTRREFWAHINVLVQGGVTVMVTTHFLDEAEYCDRIALVYRGRIIATGSPDDLKRSMTTVSRPEPTLEDAFIALVEDNDRKAAK
jgi:ABC-2 type transport system ATP-binding protein